MARYVGAYSVSAVRTSDEKLRTFMTEVGASKMMMRADIRLLLLCPKEKALPLGGVSAILDRNLNTNTISSRPRPRQSSRDDQRSDLGSSRRLYYSHC